MQISLVISSLESGGAEKVMAAMANHWARDKKSVTLITLGPPSSDFYRLDAQVKRVSLDLAQVSAGVWSAVLNNFRRVKRLREEIRREEPDLVISFMDTINILSLLAAVGLRTPVVVSERIDPRQHQIKWYWAALRKLLYRRAQGVVVQSEDVRAWAESMRHKNAVWVIPNPIYALGESSNESDGHFSVPSHERLIVGMGRLVPQKGFDLLIEAFAQCAQKAGKWTLIILGDGEERSRLKALAGDLGIGARVTLAGRVEQPLATLKKAHLFVLSSRYEGFPNALLEAMACGLAVISFDCPSGPRDIIRDDIDGVLVPPGNVAALAAAMERLMLDDEERRRLSLRATEVTERFGLERIMGQWNALLDHVATRNRQ